MAMELLLPLRACMLRSLLFRRAAWLASGFAAGPIHIADVHVWVRGALRVHAVPLRVHAIQVRHLLHCVTSPSWPRTATVLS